MAETSGVVKSAAAAGAGTLLSRILGLVREQVFAALFGASHAMDAFNIAFRIPNLLRDLFAEGAMSAALVPTFVDVQKREGQERAWRLAGLVFRVLFGLTGFIVILGWIFAEPLVALYASQFKAIPGKFELAVHLTNVMWPFFPLVALAAAYMAVLNALGAFFMPAFASALFNLTSIVVGVLGVWAAPRLGVEPITAMAVGVVAGGAVQAFSQLPVLYRRGYRYPGAAASTGQRFPGWAADPALKRMLFLMVPGTLGLAATQINLLVNSILATSQGPGAVSWLNYAFRLMYFPIGIFGVSIAVATLPLVSRAQSEGRPEAVHETLIASLRKVMAINFPAAAGLAFLSIPIIRLIYQHGHFSADDTRATAMALAAYASGLVFYSAVKVLVPACYALRQARLAVFSSVLSVILNLAFNWWAVDRYGFWGLAAGTSATAGVNAVFLLIALKIPLRSLARPFLAYGFLSVAMGILVWFADQALAGRIPRIVEVGLLVTLGLGFVIIAGRVISPLTGGREIDEALEMTLGKLRRKLGFSRKNP